MEKSMDYDYDFFILLSGEDLFIDNGAGLTAYLERNHDKSIIDCRVDHSLSWRILSYNLFTDSIFSRSLFVRGVNFFIRKCIYPLIKKSDFKKEQVFVGSSWLTLTRKHVAMIVRDFDSNYISKFRFSSCSDEHIFQMWAMQNIHKEIINGTIHFFSFSKGASNPKYLTMDDINKIKEL